MGRGARLAAPLVVTLAATLALCGAVAVLASTEEAAPDFVRVHDLHATMLYLLGIDHTRFRYRHLGRPFRLTDVHGRVVSEILA